MKISASYVKKEMVKQYEPVEIGCFIEEEYDNKLNDDFDAKELIYKAQFDFCKLQVERRMALEHRHIDATKEIRDKSSLEVAQDIGNETIGE